MYTNRMLIEIDAERVDELGFLDQAKSPRLHHCDHLLSEPVSWILGRPWIGKSTVASGLSNRLWTVPDLLPGIENRNSLTRLGFYDAVRTVRPEWWDSWVRDSNPAPAVWLIDGVDEVIDSNRFLLEQIADLIEQAPVAHLRHLRLMLFSRPYAELGWLRDRLQQRYEPLTHRSLLPQFWLTRLDRSAAAAIVGMDRMGAVEDLIRRNDLQSVAGYPVVLNFLKTYRQRTDKLTVAQVWRGVLTALLGEPQSNRVVRFSTQPQERFVAACRIAAVLTLTRHEALREYSPDQSEPTIGILFQSPDNRLHFAARDACRTALFSFSGEPAEYRFVQRNAQDWLTAFAFLDLPIPALKSALAAADGSLPVRLREVARLIRVVRTDHAAQELIEQLTGGLMLPSDAVESNLAEVLRAINHMEALAADSPWGLRRVGYESAEELARLRVEGLGAILADRLRDPARLARVKEFLIDVAQATHAVEAVDAAVQLVIDHTQDDQLRYSAMLMATRFGGPEHLISLECLITEDRDESEIECKIRAELVHEFLTRGIWPIWKVALCTPRVKPIIAHIRFTIFRWVETGMTLTDARQLLPHLRELWQRHAEEYRPHELPDYLTRAVELVLSELPPDPKDLDYLVQFVREVVGDDTGWEVARNIAIRLRTFASVRRRLYQLDLEAGLGKKIHVGNLLEPEDWSWLRDKAIGEWRGNREVWDRAYSLATLAKANGQIPDDDWQCFTQIVDEHVPSLRSEFEERRYRYEQELEAETIRRRDVEARDPNRRPLAERVTRLLNRTELTDPELMRQLSWVCLADYEVKRDRPGMNWIDLPVELQHRVLVVFCRGLQVAMPTHLPYIGDFSGNILAEGAAFDQVIGSVNHIKWLTEEMILRWLPTSLFARMSNDWAIPITACHAVSPAATETALLNTIEFHARREGTPHQLQQIPSNFWTDKMTTRLVELASDDSVVPAVRRELIEQLATRSPERADPIVNEWAVRPVTSDDGDELRKAGRNLLIGRDTDKLLSLIEADFISRGSLALEELSMLWSGHNGLAFHGVPWSLTQLERLGRLLLKVYPFAQDPDFQVGPVRPNQELRFTRDHIISALLKNTDDVAVRVLNRLANLDPELRAWVDTNLANQQATEFVSGVDPSAARDPAALSAQDAVRLLDRAGYRLIRSPDDLLDAVMEAMHKINTTVGHDLPMLYSPPSKQKKTPRKHLHEDALQAYLRRRLLDELSKIADGVDVKIMREEQVQRRQRFDLRVIAPCHGGGPLATVVVEVKWSTNKETRSGLVNQLGKRYLVGEGLTHGVYLVGWSGERRPNKRSVNTVTPESLAIEINEQRNNYTSQGQPGAGLRIEPFILNVQWSLPET